MRKVTTRVLGVGLMLLALSQAAPLTQAGAAAPAAAPYAPETVLVKFTPGFAAADRAAVMQQHGLEVKGNIWGDDTLILRAKGKNVEALVSALSKNPNVLFAEPDYIATTDMTPNDTYWSQQWAPVKIQAPAAWDITQGSASTLIAVVDTGVDLDHPDLDGKVRTDIDYDFANGDATAQDDNGHGTHVAGTAAAETNNSTGVAGLCPGCSILPVKVLNRRGSGTYSAIASGIRYAADQGAQVINLSLGGTSGSTVLEDAVNYADGKGSLLACAAGNSNTSAASYPAYYPACVAVAATDQNDARASFSNFGSWVDTSAPGVSIYNTYYNNTYSSLNGTSMATPHVAGLAGLLFSQGRTLSAVKTRLTGSTYTDPVTSTNIPRRINALKAVTN